MGPIYSIEVGSFYVVKAIELRLTPGITPFRVERAPSNVEQHCGRPRVAQMFQVHVHARTNDAQIVCDRTANQIGVEFEDGIVVEGGREALFRLISGIPAPATRQKLGRPESSERYVMSPYLSPDPSSGR